MGVTHKTVSNILGNFSTHGQITKDFTPFLYGNHDFEIDVVDVVFVVFECFLCLISNS